MLSCAGEGVFETIPIEADYTVGDMKLWCALLDIAMRFVFHVAVEVFFGARGTHLRLKYHKGKDESDGLPLFPAQAPLRQRGKETSAMACARLCVPACLLVLVL